MVWFVVGVDGVNFVVCCLMFLKSKKLFYVFVYYEIVESLLDLDISWF